MFDVSRWILRLNHLLNPYQDDLHVLLPLVNFANSQYFSRICFGLTDGTNDCLTALIDTGSYHIVIPSKSDPESHNQYNAAVPFETKKLDSAKIHSRDTNTNLKIRYGDGSFVIGSGKLVDMELDPSLALVNKSEDRVLRDQFVVFARNYNMAGGKHNVIPDVFLGLGVPPEPAWYQKDFNKSFIENYFEQHPHLKKIVALNLNSGGIPQRHSWENWKEWQSRVLASANSYLIFGTLPRRLYRGDLVAFRNPRPYESYWLVEVRQLRLESKLSTLNVNIINSAVLVDSGTSITRVKPYIWDAVASHMKHNHDCYMIPSGTLRRDHLMICACKEGYFHSLIYGPNVPVLYLSVVDSSGIPRNISLSTDQFISVVPASETSYLRGKCYISLMVGPSNMKYDIILGMNWMRSWVTVLDMDKREVSFARNKNH